MRTLFHIITIIKVQTNVNVCGVEDGCVFEKGDKLEPSSFQAWHVMLLPLVMACMVNVLYHKHTRTEWGEKKNKSDERERTSVSHFEE